MKHSNLCLLFTALLLGSCLSYELPHFGNDFRINATMGYPKNSTINIRVSENGQSSETVNLAIRTFLGPGMRSNMTHLTKNSQGDYEITENLYSNLCQVLNDTNGYAKQLFCEILLMSTTNPGGFRGKKQGFLLNFYYLNNVAFRPELIPMAPKCNRTIREIGLTLEGSCIQNSLTKNVDTTNLFLNGTTPRFIYFNCPSFRQFTYFNKDWTLSEQQSQLSICTNQSFVGLIPDYEMSQCRVVVLFANGWSSEPLTPIHVRSVNTTYAQAKYVVDPAPFIFYANDSIGWVNDTNVSNATTTELSWHDTEFYWNTTTEETARLFGYDPELVKMWNMRRRYRHQMNGTRKRCNRSANWTYSMNGTWRHGGWNGKDYSMERMRMMNHWNKHEMRKMRRHWRRHQRRHHRGGHGRRHRRRHHHHRGEGRRHRRGCHKNRTVVQQGWTTPSYGGGSSGYRGVGVGTTPSARPLPADKPMPYGPYPYSSGPAAEPPTATYAVSSSSVNVAKPYYGPQTTTVGVATIAPAPPQDIYRYDEWRNDPSTYQRTDEYRGRHEQGHGKHWKKKKCFKLIMIGLVAGCLLCCVGLCLLKACKKRCCCRRRHHHHHGGHHGFQIVQPVTPVTIPTDTQRFGGHPFNQPDAPTAYVNLSQQA